MLTIPGLCWLCQMPLACAHWGFCSRCAKSLPPPPPCCPSCGLPCANTHSPCGRCLQKPPAWDALIFVTNYCPPLSRLVQHFKFNATVALAPALARLLLLRIMDTKRRYQWPKPDCIVSVPLHSRRAWRRGFNQSDLLARQLSHWLQCDYFPQGIKRIRAAKTQHQLNARMRRNNLKGAFRVDFPVAGRHIIIVDDVVTTGSTVAEIAQMLKKQGAATIQVWCLCRTL